MKRSPWAAAALAVVSILISGSPGAESPDPAQQSFRPPKGVMIAPGKTPDLTLLYTGDAIGYIDPCG